MEGADDEVSLPVPDPEPPALPPWAAAAAASESESDSVVMRESTSMPQQLPAPPRVRRPEISTRAGDAGRDPPPYDAAGMAEP